MSKAVDTAYGVTPELWLTPPPEFSFPMENGVCPLPFLGAQTATQTSCHLGFVLPILDVSVCSIQSALSLPAHKALGTGPELQNCSQGPEDGLV